MRPASPPSPPATRSHKPRAFTVFAAAFVAGAAAAVGVNSVLDVRLAQAKPKVESEPIFVALRSLPQGAAVTVWDVALRDWPRAMVPSSALRASDAFSGLVLKHPLREGQPLLSIQLVEAEARSSSPVSVTAISAPSTTVVRMQEADLWAPAEPSTPTAAPAVSAQQSQAAPDRLETAQAQPVAQAPVGTDQAAIPTPASDTAAVQAVAPTPIATPTETEPVAVARPQPSPEGTGSEVIAPTVPTPAADTVSAAVQAAESIDGGLLADAVTDEMLEAMAATEPPVADSFVTPPADDVVAPSATVAATPTDSDSTQPTPVQTATDAIASTPSPTPTLADPPLAPIAAESTVLSSDAAGPTSVMRRPASEAEQPPAPALAPARVATRYLVVPESIALQADASFSAPRQPEPQPAARAADAAVKPLPPAKAPTGGQPTHQRASQPRRGTSASLPDNGQRPSAPQAAAQPPRRSAMFPNIAAGIETIEAEMGRSRRDRAGQAEPAAPTRTRPQY